MSDKPSKEVSRRDAMKILAAVAGAAALANLPSKWSTPELATGVLPAHAQTSNPLTVYTLAAAPNDPQANFCQELPSIARITPIAAGIMLNYVITTNSAPLAVGPGIIITSPPLTGTVPTDAFGEAQLTIIVDQFSFLADDTITVTWSFANASDGTNNGSQVFTSIGSGC
jgi:hypothetical protein